MTRKAFETVEVPSHLYHELEKLVVSRDAKEATGISTVEEAMTRGIEHVIWSIKHDIEFMKGKGAIVDPTPLPSKDELKSAKE